MTLALRSAPTISRSRFLAVLAAGTSAGPSPVTGVLAGRCYDIIVAAGLNPAILLAIFAMESQYGVTGLAPHTRNWGNVRTAFDPVLAIGHDDVHNFAIYRTWDDALADLCQRLNVRYIEQRGLTTVETMLPVYAPSSENDTGHYIDFVLAKVAQWAAEERSMATSQVGFADRDDLIDLHQNRPGTKLTGFHAFTCHETGNEAPRATAAMHRTYWNTGGSGRLISSVQFVTDELEAIQLIPIDEVAWHIGDGADQPLTDEAFFTVAGEICVNSRAGFVRAAERMAVIAARVLRAKGVAPLKDVTLRRHGSYPATTHARCPAHLTAGDWGLSWAGWCDLVVIEYGRLGGAIIASHPKFTYMSTTTASYVRQGPSRKFPIVTLLAVGTRAGYDGMTQGEGIAGNADWAHRADGLGFVHSSLLVVS